MIIKLLLDVSMLSRVIFKSCKVTVTCQMTLESVETSSKSFIIIINFIVKSIINQHLIQCFNVKKNAVEQT